MPSAPFDSAICPNATLSDLSTDRIHRFILTARQARNLPLAEDTTPQAALEYLSLVRQGRPTNAAVLLFGYEPQLHIPSSRIRCARLDSTAKPIESLTCEGTLFEMLDQAMYFALSKTDLPAEIVREAVGNAATHRDYASDANVQVTAYPDRLEVSNPGALPDSLTPAQLRQPHSSIPRNPLLAEPLYLTQYRESKGTGTNDMIARCRKAGLPEPQFKLTDSFVTVTLFQPQPDSGPAQGQAEGQTVASHLLALVRLLDQAGPLSNAEIRKRLDISRTNALERYLQPALAAGLIEPTIPDSPKSRLQKYRLTAKGKALLSS